MTPAERQGLVIEAVARFAQTSGCCANANRSGTDDFDDGLAYLWDGMADDSLCAYHQGMLDGMLLLLAELEQLGDARRDVDEWQH